MYGGKATQDTLYEKRIFFSTKRKEEIKKNNKDKNQ